MFGGGKKKKLEREKQAAIDAMAAAGIDAQVATKLDKKVRLPPALARNFALTSVPLPCVLLPILGARAARSVRK